MLLEANMGGDKKPSAQYFVGGGHGKTVAGRRKRREETLRRVLHTTARDLQALEHMGLHGSHASGMQSVAFTPALGRGGHLCRDRSGPGHGRHQQHGARRARANRRRHPPGDSPARAGGRHGRRRNRACRTRGRICRCWAASGRAARTVWRRSWRPRRCASSCRPSASASTPGSENFALAHLQQRARLGARPKTCVESKSGGRAPRPTLSKKFGRQATFRHKSQSAELLDRTGPPVAQVAQQDAAQVRARRDVLAHAGQRQQAQPEQ